MFPPVFCKILATFVLAFAFIAPTTADLTSGKLYTIVAYEQQDYDNGIKDRYACEGTYLSYHTGTSSSATVYLDAPGTSYPPPVWKLVVPKAGNTSQFMFIAANKTSSTPVVLSANKAPCSNTSIFLSKSSTKYLWSETGSGVNFINSISPRSCGNEVVGPSNIAQGKKCSPGKNGLKLYKLPPSPSQLGWRVMSWNPIPAVLLGPRVPLGPDPYGSTSASIGTSDNFGASFFVDGSVMGVVQLGSVFVFKQVGAIWGAWKRQTLAAPPTPIQASSVLAGTKNFIVIGNKATSSKSKGAVYAYLAKNWAAKPVALPLPKGATSGFGTAVAASGNYAAVYDPTLGNVFVYAFDGSKFSAPVTLSNSTIFDGKGVSMSDNNIAVIFACGTNVYSRDGASGKWSLQLVAPNMTHVSVSDDTLAGSYCKPGSYDPGSQTVDVIVYTLDSASKSWKLTQQFPAPTVPDFQPTSEPPFVSVPAIDGDVMIIRVWDNYGSDPNEYESVVWVYSRAGGGAGQQWKKQTQLQLGSGVDVDSTLGITASISGNLIAVGAPGDEGGSYTAPQYGAVYIWNKDLLD